MRQIPPSVWQITNIAVILTTIVLYITRIIYLKSFFGLNLIVAVLLLASAVLAIKQKQLRTLGFILILAIGIITMPKFAASYVSVGAGFETVGNMFTKFYGIVLLIPAVAYFLVYNAYIKEYADPIIDKVEAFMPQVSQEEEIYHPPVHLCKDVNNGLRDVGITGKDRYLHTLLIGSTGTGKTSTVLAPMVWQDLQNLYKGHSLGITVIAPDHEFCHQVRDWCIGLGIPYTMIDLDDPDGTSHFNPLEGDPTIVSEIMRSVLRATFGDQDAFFAQAQELHAKNTMLLLKKLRGDNLTLLDVYQALMDIEEVQGLVDQYIDTYGEDIITTYFKKEAFGRNKDKLHQFAMGLRMQISDLLGNSTVYNVLVDRSDIDLDKHMAEGGVLLINTALGKMGHMSRVFGQFLIMHIQNAVFRRAGDEFTRIPHYLYVDELPVYFNPELKNLLNLGRKYRCASTFTIQGPSQLEVGKEGSAMREIIINGCRNKIVIGVESAKDAIVLSEMFGEDEDKEVRATRKRWSILPESYSETDSRKVRYTYTNILELKPWHGLVKIVKNGNNMRPIEGRFEEPWLFKSKVDSFIHKVDRHKILI